MKKFFEEFKEFINQGNVMDLAVAVVIGTAFTAIVNSVVSDLIMPIVGAFTGGVTAAAGGIAAAVFFGYLAAVLFKPKMKS